MRYTELGSTGMQVSALGFGCMRLPMADGKVDRERSTPLLRRAVEMGVNFFDTAIGYCDGDSQPAVGEALEAVRDRVIISTKNHHHTLPPGEWRRHLEDSLRLLRTDYIDLYNHHGINWNTFVEHLDPDKGGLTKEMLKAKDEGLVRHVGFSFHAPPEQLVKLADTGYYEHVILQYNLLDQVNSDAIHHAREQGLGIIVMGPIGGGRLGLPSAQVRELTGGAVRSTPEAALRFVWAHPAVNVALSGMENLEMLEENVRVAEDTTPFTPEQIAALNAAVDERKRKSGLYCSGCRYCVPACAAGVSIPEQLDLLNLVKIYGLRDAARQRYDSPWTVKVKARECISCGACLEKCPQNIDIPARMHEVVTLLDPDAGTVSVDAALATLSPDGTFSLRVKTQSLANESGELEVALKGQDGVCFETPALVFGEIPPFGRLAKTSPGTYPTGSESIGFVMDVRQGERSEHLEKTCRFMILHSGRDERWEGGDWTPVPAPVDSFTADRDTASLHGARFKLSYDTEGLVLLVDVRDDFLFPSREQEHRGQLVDSVEVFLDGRAPQRVGRARYEKGVHQITLYPGDPGKSAPFVHPAEHTAVELDSERTQEGYRLRACIPFSAFTVHPGVPKKLGFDLAVNTANRAGERIAQYAWAGGSENWRDASGFREVWLV
ncbi:MAG: 4Fe-4S dicluster domain-containing protein [Chitinivibrionales bacterium]|nr:4Fe-4S dicluster domain-containing protein [Chitinivibrionales bacterium]